MSLAFFNALSAKLEIELSERTKRISAWLANETASPSATIEAIRLRPSLCENDRLRPLSDEELGRVVLDQPDIRLRGYGDVVAHRAPNGATFTVRDLFAAIEETERQTRHQSTWLEGIDTHHVFFEGITSGEDGVWKVRWGS